MDLDLKEFSLTIAVGIAASAIVFWSLVIVASDHATRLLAWIRHQQPSAWVAPAILATVPLLALGLIIEDLSKRAMDGGPPHGVGERLQWILPTDDQIRVMTLANVERSSASTMAQCFGLGRERHAGTPIAVSLTSMGRRVYGMLDGHRSCIGGSELDHLSKLASIQDEPLFPMAWSGRLGEAGHLPTPPARQPRLHGQFWATCEELIQTFPPLYYVAKNFVYQHSESYFQELEELRDRYVFQRSIAYALLTGLYFLCFVYLAKSALEMWNDLGIFKTVLSVLLLLVLTLGLFDAVSIGSLSGVVAQLTSTGADAAGDGAKPGKWRAVVDAIRHIALPLAFLWVCMHRLRRVYRRVAPVLQASLRDELRGPALLRLPREKTAGHALGFALVLIALMVPIRLAYEDDQGNYISRVFGYYDTSRTLECKG